jgi:hypothetical protein
MLIVALVLAGVGLAALVFAVVASNGLMAWVCIGASVLGVVLLIIDALQERRRGQPGEATEPPPEPKSPQPRLEDVTANYDQVPSGRGAADDFYADADYPEDPSTEGDDTVGDDGATATMPVHSASWFVDDAVTQESADDDRTAVNQEQASRDGLIRRSMWRAARGPRDR